MNKNNLVGILYSNDSIEIVSMDRHIKQRLEESDVYEYKGVDMYLFEDVVYCVGKDKKVIKDMLKKFNKDPEVQEEFGWS